MSSNTSGTSPTPAPQTGRPRIGIELGRGAEGAVYENLDRPGWVFKEFHQGATSPLQAANEFANLVKARAIHPDNVVNAQAPADPRQGWIVKEQVIRDAPTPTDVVRGQQIKQDFVNGGVQDVGSNLVFGHAADDPNPRWILLE